LRKWRAIAAQQKMRLRNGISPRQKKAPDEPGQTSQGGKKRTTWLEEEAYKHTVFALRHNSGVKRM
jgi:hypothetical protein